MDLSIKQSVPVVWINAYLVYTYKSCYGFAYNQGTTNNESMIEAGKVEVEVDENSRKA